MTSQKLFQNIEKIENICINRFNSKYQSTNVRIDFYYKVDDESDPKFISKEEIIEDRNDMLDCLCDFYDENIDNQDDFVTIFGVYCNYYIRFNLHQVLTEKDFGLSRLFDKIDDVDLKDYLDLIHKGIYKQDIYYFIKAIEIKETFSLPYLYLFIDSIKRYCSTKYNEQDLEREKEEISLLSQYIKNNIEDISVDSNIDNYFKNKIENQNPDSLDSSNSLEDDSMKIIEYYEKLNDDLKDYVLGKSSFFRDSKNIDIDKHPLPYLKILKDEGELQDSLIKSLCHNFKNYIDENNYGSLKSSVEKIFMKVRNIDFEDFNRKQVLLNSDFIEERMLYIGIPSIVFQFNFFELLLKQSKLYKEKKEIQDSKENIVNEFTHKYKNMKATTLSDVAQILLKKESEELRSLGNQILLEFVNKQSLTRDVYMMQIEYQNNSEKLRDIIKNSLLHFQDESKIGIEYVIDKALIFCFINIFYNHNFSSLARKNLKRVWKNFDDFGESFKNNVMLKNENCITWLSKNDILCDLTISDNWNFVSLESENYAFIYLKDIFQELFLNFIRHGNLEKPIKFDLYSENDRLIIHMENHFKLEKAKSVTTKLGLKSLGSTLPMLYEYDIPVEDCIITQKEDDKFILDIKMPKNIFILEKED